MLFCLHHATILEGIAAPYESENSVILHLAAQGTDVNSRDKYGLTPHHYAILFIYLGYLGSLPTKMYLHPVKRGDTI